MEFTILPMFYQTNWFLALWAAALALLGWLSYKWRVRQVKNLLHLQFPDLLAERTRIAQDLHDKLLQGFVSAKIQLFTAVHDLRPDTSKTKRMWPSLKGSPRTPYGFSPLASLSNRVKTSRMAA